MAPVVLTVVGSKLIPQLVKGAAVSVTEAAVEELLTSLPIWMMKGSVVIAGLGLVILPIVIVAEANCKSEGKAPVIVKLLPVVEQANPEAGVKSSRTESQVGVVRVYWEGKTTIILDPEGTGWVS